MNIGRSIKNVGSKATKSAVSKAEKTSLGANKSAILSKTHSSPASKMMKRQIHRGSSAGLRNEKSVYLQMEGTGYLNPANQTARYKTKTPSPNRGININTSTNFTPRNKTFDIRPFQPSYGSIKMLRERL